MEREIINLIIDSKESFRNADLIANHIKFATENVFNNYFQELDKAISRKYPELLEGLVDLEEDEEQEFDEWGIYYIVKKLDDNKKLALSISCRKNSNVWVGFNLCDENDKDIEFEKYLNIEDVITGNFDSHKIYFARKYVCDDVSERPDFKNHNEAFYSLLDPAGLNSFVEKTMNTIDELLSSLKPEFQI